VSQDEIRSVLTTLGPGKLLDAIAEGFIGFSSQKVAVANVSHLAIDAHGGSRGGDACIKSGYVRGAESWVVKVASGWPGNESSFGLSNSQGCMLVFSQQSGALESVLADDGLLTDIRTAKAAALCVREFAPAVVGSLASIAVVGPGVIATHLCEQLTELAAVSTKTTELMIIGRSEERASACAEKARSFGWEAVTSSSLDEAGPLFSRSQVIITCTPATKPILHDWQLRPPDLKGDNDTGKLIVALGADAKGKRELGRNLFEPRKISSSSAAAEDGGGSSSSSLSTSKPPVVIADSRYQCLAFGECASAVADGALDPLGGTVLELGECLRGVKSGAFESSDFRATADRDVVVDLTGVAVQDVAIASLVVEALK
jgi:ornithine cyclodeaminase